MPKKIPTTNSHDKFLRKKDTANSLGEKPRQVAGAKIVTANIYCKYLQRSANSFT